MLSILKNKIYLNSIWMMAEKIIYIFGLIFVTSQVAKYIGPDNFGKLVYVTSIFTFIVALAKFGNENIFFKQLSKNKKIGIKLILATSWLRNILLTIPSAFCLIYLYFYTDNLTFIFGLATAIATYYIVNDDIFIIYNNTQLISRVNVITTIIGLIIALSTRYIFVLIQAKVWLFAIPIILVSIIPYFLRRYIFFKNNQYHPPNKVKNILRYNKYLAITGSSLVLSSLAIVLYTQIAQITLATYISKEALGIYSVALTIGVSWNFVNHAIITSSFPRIYSEKNQDLSIRLAFMLFSLVTLMSLFVGINILLFGEKIIITLYGNQYAKASTILCPIILGAYFSSVGNISNQFIIKYSGYRYLSIKMILTCFIACGISFILINKYGLSGAAYFYLIIEILSSTLLNYFFKSSLLLKIHFYPLFKLFK